MTDTMARVLQWVMPRRAFYRRVYLRTDHWRKVAAEARIRAGHRCERCGVRGSYRLLETHHRSYANLWHERDTDLQVLCHDCHFKLHRRRGY